MHKMLSIAAILLLFTTTATLADNDKPASDSNEEAANAAPTDKKWELQDGPNGPVLQEVEELRKQLGPEYSIESPELGIERDHANNEPQPEQKPPQEWNGGRLYQEVREMVKRFRQDARHLEEMAAHAEQLSEFALADQLRGIALRQWEAARELSQPRSTRGYYAPEQTPLSPPGLPASNTQGSNWEWGPTEINRPKTEIPSKSAPSYGVPSAPKQRFSVPNQEEPKKR